MREWDEIGLEAVKTTLQFGLFAQTPKMADFLGFHALHHHGP